MAAIHNIIFSILILILILICCCDYVMASNKTVIRGVYYPSWARESLKPSAINTSYFTHIYYAFLTPNNVSFKFQIDTKREAPFLRDFTSTLRSKKVKTLFSIGGSDSGTNLFSDMIANNKSRKAFIDSCIEVAIKYGFDGFDLDYEFPKNAKEMANLGLLFKEWRAAVQTMAKNRSNQQLLITAAVYYSAIYQNGPKYPADAIKHYLDWVNVMNYDYHGVWEKTVTGAHAALFDPKTNLSTYYGIGSWIDAGVPSWMLVMGIPMYGKTWKLRSNTQAQKGVGAPAAGPGENNGTMIYADVVKWNLKNKVSGVFDKATVSEYSVVNSSWIGYDGPTTVSAKVIYARAINLGGYFFWSVQQDFKWTLSKAAFEFW